VRYNQKTDLENYCRERLLLFIPWRNEISDLLGPGEDHIDNYFNNLDEIELKQDEYEKNSHSIDIAQEQAENEQTLDFGEVAPSAVQQNADDEQCPTEGSKDFGFFDPRRPYEQRNMDIGVNVGLAPRSYDVEPDILPGRIPDCEYMQLIQSLNERQSMVLKHALKHIKSQDKPLHLLIHGGAGVGKSILLTALYQSLDRALCSKEGDDPENRRIVVCSYTAKAAHNVHGNTIHSTFNILPNRTFMFTNLKADKLNTMQVKYRNLKVVMIDEISMVGNKMFNIINLRLQEIMRNKKHFGGVHVIAIGDLFQLKPMFDDWIFQDLKSTAGHEYGSLATNLWVENFSIIELTEIMRQKDDINFANALNRLREGKHTVQDLQVFETRLVKKETLKELEDIPHLYATNKLVDAHNEAIFNKTNTEKIDVEAIDVIHGDLSGEVKERIKRNISAQPSATANLHQTVHLGISLRYSITSNINVEDGITNGSEGILMKIEYEQNRTIPKVLWMKFDDAETGKMQRRTYKSFFKQGIDKTWTPIFAIKRHFHTGRSHAVATRWQFPFVICAAKTIHKSQGSTLKNVVVDMTSRMKVHHLHYVALSRVTSLRGLSIINLNKEKIATDSNVFNELDRLRNEASATISYVSPKCVSDENMRIGYLNTRSLHRHINHIKRDYDLTNMDIFAIAESRLCSHDQDANYSIKNFNMYRNDQAYTGQSRPPHGIVVYIHKRLTVDVHHVSDSDIEATLVITDQERYIFVYKSPSCNFSKLLTMFTEIANEPKVRHPLVIIGDLNIDAGDATNKDKVEMLECTTGTKQIVDNYTTDRKTILDLVFTNMDASRIHYSIIENTWSDHKIIFFFHDRQ